jgi:hypothetical protein
VILMARLSESYSVSVALPLESVRFTGLPTALYSVVVTYLLVVLSVLVASE